MTLDEAIKLYKDLERINREEYEIFNRDGLNPKSALITAQRYEQLVEWLKELKSLKAKDKLKQYTTRVTDMQMVQWFTTPRFAQTVNMNLRKTLKLGDVNFDRIAVRD